MGTRIIAVTGGIGSGKSSLCSALQNLGVSVFSADDSARRAMARGTEVHAQLRAELPEFFEDESLDRTALAAAMFADPVLRARIEALVHPWVRTDMATLALQADTEVVALDIPLLSETRSRDAAQAEFDYVVTVWAPSDVRVQRVVSRGMSIDDVRARMSAQADDQSRQSISDVVVPNTGDFAGLANAAQGIFMTTLRLPRRRT